MTTDTGSIAKTAMIRARTQPSLKNKAEKILAVLGMNPSEAINLFYKQVLLQNGLPFEVRIPNKLTKSVMRDTDRTIDRMKSIKA
jgi:DNA-damage-inducible protein J